MSSCQEIREKLLSSQVRLKSWRFKRGAFHGSSSQKMGIQHDLAKKNWSWHDLDIFTVDDLTGTEPRKNMKKWWFIQQKLHNFTEKKAGRETGHRRDHESCGTFWQSKLLTSLDFRIFSWWGLPSWPPVDLFEITSGASFQAETRVRLTALEIRARWPGVRLSFQSQILASHLTGAEHREMGWNGMEWDDCE